MSVIVDADDYFPGRSIRDVESHATDHAGRLGL
jgi:hypothetical protein